MFCCCHYCNRTYSKEEKEINDEESDDVYLSFTIGALEGSSDNPMELLKLKDVQTILSSATFIPAQETETAN